MSKLVIPKEQFGEVDAYTGHIFLKFRLVSDDKNRFSYWSPVFEIDPEAEFIQGNFDIPGDVIATKQTGYVTLAWSSVGVYNHSTSDYIYLADLPSYDVWVQYGGNNMINAGPWYHYARINTTSLNIIIPNTYTYTDTNGATQTGTVRQMKIEIHRPVRPVIRWSPNRTIFKQDISHISLTNNTITFDSNHGFATGEDICYYVYNAASAINPLLDGGHYWVRALTDNVIALYNTQQDALSDTNRIDFLSAGQDGGVLVKNPWPRETSIDTLNDIVTLPFAHNFKTGDAVIFNATTTTGGLTKETLYFVRVIDVNKIKIYKSRVGAIKDIALERINLTATGNGYATLALLPSLLYKKTEINLNA